MAVKWLGGNDEAVGDLQAECGEIIAAGELITIRTNAGDDKAYVACADGGNEDMPAMGIAHADYADGDIGLFHRVGKVSGLPVSVDGYAYLSNTPGDFSATAGDTPQVVAIYVDGANGDAELAFANVAHDHPAES